MLKFFRQYMKYILVVSVSVLMIAFLIQPTLSLFTPSPGDEVIGTIDGQELNRSDQHRAVVELEILESLSRLMPLLVPPGVEDPLQWLLAMREAQAMGLSASDYEIDQLIHQIDRAHGQEGLMATQIARLRKQNRIPPAAVRAILRKRLVYQQYWGLMRGLDYPSLPEQIEHLQAAQQFEQAGYASGSIQQILAMQGAPRLSDPLRRRLVLDQFSTVKIQAVAVDGSRYLHRVEQDPTDAQLEQLFEKYKDDLPGTGQPDGLGYRIPDRVKIEYLKVPFDRVLAQFPIEAINEADAMDYYDNHRDAFTIDPPSQPGSADPPVAPQVRPYAQVRNEIKGRLRDQRASDASDRIVKSAQAMLLDEARALGTAQGYFVVPDNWQPMSLEDVADRLENQHGIRPDVRRHVDSWQTAQDLVALPGIGSSAVVGRRPVPFLQYVGSVREMLDPEKKSHPLASLRLQTKLPSTVLLGNTQPDRYLFRLVEVQRSHTPASWQETRDQLDRDARKLAAYELLKQDKQMWVDRALKESMAELAQALGAKPLNPPPFPRRQPRGRAWGFRLDTPVVEGIGASETFVDAVFESAQEILNTGGIEDASPAQRTAAIPVDSDQKLILVELQEISPMTRSAFNQFKPSADAWIGQALLAQDVSNPITVDALEDRLGFEPSYRPDDPESDSDDQEADPEASTATSPPAGDET